MKHIFTIVTAFLVILITGCQQNNTTSQLEDNFKNPPASVKPKTWMHAMSGNMSKEGLTKDFESMAKVGIGGVMLFNIAQGIPNGPIKYNSDEHHELIQHAAKECERLGLSFGVHNCDGWSSSGGPWIKPEQSMKMVVWSEKVVAGGKELEVQLEQATTREGFYKDIAVIAYPSLESEIKDANIKPILTASDKEFKIFLANDFKLDEASTLKAVSGKDGWLQYDYGRPFTIRSAYAICNDRNGEIMLQSSNDGKTFTNVGNLAKERTGKGEWVHTGQYEPLTARYFRLKLTQTMTFKEARLMATTSINNVFGRTAMARTEDQELKPIGNPGQSMIINKESIINLSADMNSEGILKTKLPEGNWTVMRFGYTSTGAFNHPASDSGRGLECDKLNRAAFKTHYDAFVSRVAKEAGALAPNALQYIEIDSYEMGGQNWTDDFISIFKNAKGYDLTEFLPLFAGRFVESAESSEAVTWDLRKVIGDLMTENYFGYFSELCHADGLKSYIEPYGNGPVNDLDVGGKADINMGEFWMNRPMTMVQSAVSASHVYGKTITSAESFTSTPEINWKGNPAMAKISGDLAWTHGINEFMFHRFAHQANTHVLPGMTMNRWGFHFDRTQTWWENAGADWFKYMARGQYLLRQGVPVSDLLVFVGDGAPNSVFKRDDFEPAIPAGINFDCSNADVLINRIKTENEKMVLPEGTEYKMLVLKNCENISLETLQRIYEISVAGVPVVGKKPTRMAGYAKFEKDKTTFAKLADEIWENQKTYSDFNWEKIMKAENITSDFEIFEREDFPFIHRQMEKQDIYFLFNPDSSPQQFKCTFRVKGKIPELWNPMTGDTKKSGQFMEDNGHTKVWINLDAEESVFVVFRESSKGISAVSNTEDLAKGEYFLTKENQLKVEVFSDKSPQKIEGSWEVEFLKENDFAAKQVFDELTDWKDNPDENVKYYSGTAIYRTTFNWENDMSNPDKYILDLGDVKIVAEVTLNGKNLGVDWIPPFELDITDALVQGENQLEIRITNQWSNKLIGDERFPPSYVGYKLEGNFPKGKMMDWYINNEPLPAGQRTTFCTADFYKVGDELMPSGLLGPVFIKKKKIIQGNYLLELKRN